jgi:hypothetical protein
VAVLVVKMGRSADHLQTGKTGLEAVIVDLSSSSAIKCLEC